MGTKTITSREFNQDVSGAKRAATRGRCSSPTEGVRPHVLLSIEEYHRLTGGRATIGELLALPGAEDVDFEPPHASDLARPADLS